MVATLKEYRRFRRKLRFSPSSPRNRLTPCQTHEMRKLGWTLYAALTDLANRGDKLARGVVALVAEGKIGIVSHKERVSIDQSSISIPVPEELIGMDEEKRNKWFGWVALDVTSVFAAAPAALCEKAVVESPPTPKVA